MGYRIEASLSEGEQPARSHDRPGMDTFTRSPGACHTGPLDRYVRESHPTTGFATKEESRPTGARPDVEQVEVITELEKLNELGRLIRGGVTVASVTPTEDAPLQLSHCRRFGGAVEVAKLPKHFLMFRVVAQRDLPNERSAWYSLGQPEI